MTTGPDVIEDQSFWDDWEDRFVEEVDKYITPRNSRVVRVVERLNIGGLGTLADDVDIMWQWINLNIRYKLSKEWKTPNQTILEGVGDCEDMDFLFLSMVPWAGANEADVVSGNFISSGSSGAHTWTEVGGRIVDPTTTPGPIDPGNYHEKMRVTVNYNGCSSCH